MLSESLDLIVVDDNSVLVSVLSEIFSECGYRVRAASNGFGALAEIKKRVPDILISDLCMPGMSGYELLSVVRRRFPSIRVIAMSGAFSGEAVPSGIAADAFYAKGASSVAQLIQTVSSVWLHEATSTRFPTPIWVATLSSDQVGASVVLVSCPECLRPFIRQAESFDLPSSKDSCPHCTTMFELAFVRPSHGTDGTPISAEPATAPIGRATMRTKASTGAPSERMHQQ
jgi:CheY-like chemotaxis protein